MFLRKNENSALSEHACQTIQLVVFNQPLETPRTIRKRTTSGGRTKEAHEKSFVFVHQRGGDTSRENLLLGRMIPKLLSPTRQRYHQRICLEAWHINSAHIPFIRHLITSH